MLKLESRESLADLANALGLKHAAEVGTHQAVFAQAFMRRFRGDIVLIDKWDGHDPTHTIYFPYFDGENTDRQKDLQIATEAMSEFGERVTFKVSDSVSAAKLVEDGSLDFVYIDAAHEYDDVHADIIAWYPKVRSGGIFSGHDYHFSLPGVIQAVDEFCASNNVSVTIIDEPMNSWWMVKS